MTADPRAALNALVAAFERHLEACSEARGKEDPAVASAADHLADAFEAYDDALLAAYGELTPLEVYGDDEDDEDSDDEDDDEDDASEDVDPHDDEDGEDGVYSGFDGDYDVEEQRG